MNIKSLKIYQNIEDNLKKRQEEEQKIMLSRARNSLEWQNHAKKCKSPKIVTLEMNGMPLENGQERLDSDLWRKSLEQKSKELLNNELGEVKSDNFSINSSIYSTENKNVNINTGDYVGSIMSTNFSTDQPGECYDHVKFSVGCMCGVDLDIQEEIKTNEYGVTNSSTTGIYTTSNNKNNTYSA